MPFVFNPVVTVSEPNLFQMSQDLVIPETTPRVEADEDLNFSVSWEPPVLFTVRQGRLKERACAACRGGEGPLASHVCLIRKEWSLKQVLILPLPELLNELEVESD